MPIIHIIEAIYTSIYNVRPSQHIEDSLSSSKNKRQDLKDIISDLHVKFSYPFINKF